MPAPTVWIVSLACPCRKFNEAGDIVLEHVRRVTADVSEVNLSDEHLSFLKGVSLECAASMLKDRRALHASLVSMSSAVALAGTFQPADDPRRCASTWASCGPGTSWCMGR